MTTYMSHILRFADRAGFPTAAEYDGQFRIQWAERILPWEIFRGDILFEVEDHIRHQRGTRPFCAGGTGSGAFTRHCFRFNKRGACTKRSCPYSHRFPSVDGRITVRPHVATPTKRSPVPTSSNSGVALYDVPLSSRRRHVLPTPMDVSAFI